MMLSYFKIAVVFSCLWCVSSQKVQAQESRNDQVVIYQVESMNEKRLEESLNRIHQLTGVEFVGYASSAKLFYFKVNANVSVQKAQVSEILQAIGPYVTNEKEYTDFSQILSQFPVTNQ